MASLSHIELNDVPALHPNNPYLDQTEMNIIAADGLEILHTGKSATMINGCITKILLKSPWGQ